jgi:hypothetical protein
MKKLTAQNQYEVFERIICDRSGRTFRVRFVIVERGGALRGRVVSRTPVSEAPSVFKEGCPKGGVVVFLPLENKAHTFHLIQKIGARITSPYFNKFAFLTVIKIRAPSFK